MDRICTCKVVQDKHVSGMKDYVRYVTLRCVAKDECSLEWRADYNDTDGRESNTVCSFCCVLLPPCRWWLSCCRKLAAQHTKLPVSIEAILSLQMLWWEPLTTSLFTQNVYSYSRFSWANGPDCSATLFAAMLHSPSQSNDLKNPRCMIVHSIVLLMKHW